MLRKSSVSPPCTPSLCHVLPTSFDCKITPFDPEAQITGAGAWWGSPNSATLTPRKFVSMPLVCRVHRGRSLMAARTKIAAARTIKKGACSCTRWRRMSRILAAVQPEGRDYSRGSGGRDDSVRPNALIFRQDRQDRGTHASRIIAQLDIQ